jgi:hypothetical protein
VISLSGRKLWAVLRVAPTCYAILSPFFKITKVLYLIEEKILGYEDETL